MSAEQVGHLCSTADAITPLEDGTCPWCGGQPTPTFRWDADSRRWVELP